MTRMFTIMKQTNSVITIFIQPDERDGEPEHDEPRHAGDDEHEQWHAGIISFRNILMRKSMFSRTANTYS